MKIDIRVWNPKEKKWKYITDYVINGIVETTYGFWYGFGSLVKRNIKRMDNAQIRIDDGDWEDITNGR